MAQTTKLTGSGIPPATATYIIGDNDIGVTATGNNQATAYMLAKTNTFFSTVAASTGAILPSGIAGDEMLVSNQGANSLSIYPPVGGAINSLSTNAALSVAATKVAYATCASANGLNWHVSVSA